MQVKNTSATQPWFVAGVMIAPQAVAEVPDSASADIKGHADLKAVAAEVEAPKRGRPVVEKDAE